MSRLSEFSTILGLYIDISSIINKAQSNEGGKIMNLLETGEGIALLIVINFALIYIHRSWLREQWKEFKNPPTRKFMWTDDDKFIFSRLEREPLIFPSGAHETDLSFLDK